MDMIWDDFTHTRKLIEEYRQHFGECGPAWELAWYAVLELTWAEAELTESRQKEIDRIWAW